MTEKIVQIKQRMQAVHDRQKSYADLKHKPMEFQVRDKVMLKVSPWKGVVRFGKRGKLNPRADQSSEYVSRVQLKKYHADEPLAVPLDGLHFDDKLHFVKKPVEIIDREVKRLKQSRIPLVKVRWNSKRGPEFTWEHEDQFRKKYPHLFAKTASSSSVASNDLRGALFMIYLIFAHSREINEDLQLKREINALYARLIGIIDEKENFVDELDMLVRRSVPEKMAEFMKQVQGKDISILMKLQILRREFELRAREKGIFIEKLKGNVDF
nr:putative reverse transcriptase domain-containing protein [Tanacetum cinerariifolium]